MNEKDRSDNAGSSGSRPPGIIATANNKTAALVVVVDSSPPLQDHVFACGNIALAHAESHVSHGRLMLRNSSPVSQFFGFPQACLGLQRNASTKRELARRWCGAHLSAGAMHRLVDAVRTRTAIAFPYSLHVLARP